MTLTDNFNDQLIVKDLMNIDNVIQIEIYNEAEDGSYDFNLTLGDAERLTKELQEIINCNIVGV